jgi:hypothetical protein
MAKAKIKHDTQALAFIGALHGQGWMSLNSWEDGGHVFEMLQRVGAHRRVIVQIYPDGNGFEVWRPVCEGNSIAETAAAVALYGDSK